MVRGKNRIPYWIDRRLTGLAEPDYDATISFGLPIEPEDSQYGKYRLNGRRSRGLREHGVRLQNLVIDAEYRFVELLPPAKRGRPWEVMLPAGNINLPRDAGLGWVSAAAGLAPFGTP